MKFTEDNGHLFSTDDQGSNRAVICKALVASQDGDRVRVSCGKHSASFPCEWLQGAPKRVARVVDSLGAEVRSWHGTQVALVAWLVTQVEPVTNAPCLVSRVAYESAHDARLDAIAVIAQ